nr:uncharacterized protein LOC113820755 [Penaeus vannamei]
MRKILTLGLVSDVRLYLSGQAEDESLHYDPASVSPQVTVRTFFQVENKGPTAAAEVPVKILVPVAYSSSAGLNFTFGEVVEVSLASSCSDEGVVSDMGGVTDGEVSKPPFDTTLSVTCAAPGFLCHSFTCTFRETQQAQAVALNTRYNFEQMQAEFGSNATPASTLGSHLVFRARDRQKRLGGRVGDCGAQGMASARAARPAHAHLDLSRVRAGGAGPARGHCSRSV